MSLPNDLGPEQVGGDDQRRGATIHGDGQRCEDGGGDDNERHLITQSRRLSNFHQGTNRNKSVKNI